MAEHGESTPNENPRKRRYPACDDKGRRHRAEQAIRSLRSLPNESFRTCVCRLQQGDRAIDVANWLFEQPDRGACSHLSLNTLRVYLLYLRRDVLKRDPHARKRFDILVRDTARDIHREQVHCDNVIAIHQAGETSGDAGTPKPPETPPAPERSGKVSEQTCEEIEAEVRERLKDPIAFEKFMTREMVMSEKRQLLAWELESRMGFPMKEGTAISNNKIKLIALHRKRSGATESQNKNFERWGAIDGVDDAAASPEQRKVSHVARQFTPVQYDAAVRLTEIFNELTDLQQEEPGPSQEKTAEPEDEPKDS